MKKRILCILSAFLVFLSIPLQCIPVSASTYAQTTFEPLVHSWTPSSSHAVYNYDYYILIGKTPSIDSQLGIYRYNFYLYCIGDKSSETYGTPEGRLYFETGSEPQYNRLYFNRTSNGISVDYEESKCYSFDWYYTTSNAFASGEVLSSSIDVDSGIFDFTFDNLYSDYFPTYTSSSTHFPYTVLASNVDLYNYEGQLLQYGNYYTFLRIFPNFDKSKITDYSGHETSAGVTVPDPTEPPPTKPVEEQQVEISNNILDNIKNMLSTIVNLPSKIADAIGGFFTSLGETIGGFFSDLAEKIKGFFIDLGNTILDGLKFLFVPSDNLFLDLIDLIHEKFGFIFQILEIGDFIINYDFKESPPDATVKFDNSWGHFEAEIMDWSIIEPYRNLIKNLVLAISWYLFLRKVQKRLPDIINGVSSGGDA